MNQTFYATKKVTCNTCGEPIGQGESLCDACDKFDKKYGSKMPSSLKKSGSSKPKKAISQSSPSVISKQTDKKTSSISNKKQEPSAMEKKQELGHKICLDLISNTQLYPGWVPTQDPMEGIHTMHFENGYQFCKVSDKFGNMLLFHEHQDQETKNTRIFYCLSKDSKLCVGCIIFLQLKTFPNLYAGIKTKQCIYYETIKM